MFMTMTVPRSPFTGSKTDGSFDQLDVPRIGSYDKNASVFVVARFDPLPGSTASKKYCARTLYPAAMTA